jgi:hypothetical protein
MRYGVRIGGRARRQVSRRAMSSFVKFRQVLSSFVKALLDATSSNFKGLRPKRLTNPPSRRFLAAWTAFRFERRASRRSKGKDNPDWAIREEIVALGMTGHDEDAMRIPDRRPCGLAGGATAHGQERRGRGRREFGGERRLSSWNTRARN